MFETVGVLYRGLILGAVVAAPVGPLGLLCIRRSLQKGVLIGLATGLGAAIADAIFGAIAVFGLSAILGFIHEYEATIRVVGGLIVLATAWHTWFDHPKSSQKPPHLPHFMPKVLDELSQEEAEPIQFKNHRIVVALRSMLSGFIIAATNPLALFGTLAVVATFGGVTRKFEANVLITGIFCGSLAWWFFLSSSVGLLRRHFTDSRIVTVNRVTAIGLAILAAWAIVSGIGDYFA